MNPMDSASGFGSPSRLSPATPHKWRLFSLVWWRTFKPLVADWPLHHWTKEKDHYPFLFNSSTFFPSTFTTTVFTCYSLTTGLINGYSSSRHVSETWIVHGTWSRFFRHAEQWCSQLMKTCMRRHFEWIWTPEKFTRGSKLPKSESTGTLQSPASSSPPPQNLLFTTWLQDCVRLSFKYAKWSSELENKTTDPCPGVLPCHLWRVKWWSHGLAFWARGATSLAAPLLLAVIDGGRHCWRRAKAVHAGQEPVGLVVSNKVLLPLLSETRRVPMGIDRGTLF